MHAPPYREKGNDRQLCTVAGGAGCRAYARAAIEADHKRKGEVVVTKTPEGEIIAVTRQDDEGRILSMIAEAESKRRGEPVGEIYCRIYHDTEQHRDYLKARFHPDTWKNRVSFEWQGHRWAYRYTHFDDSGEYDLIARTAPQPAEQDHPERNLDMVEPVKVPSMEEIARAAFGKRLVDAPVDAPKFLDTIKPKPAQPTTPKSESIDELAHEIWSAAQLAPGEGIVDGVGRVVALLVGCPTEQITWEDAERVADLPEVDECLRGFADEPSGEAGIEVVRAVMAATGRHSEPVGVPSDDDIAALSLQFVGLEPLSDFDHVGFSRALLARYGNAARPDNCDAVNIAVFGE